MPRLKSTKGKKIRSKKDKDKKLAKEEYQEAKISSKIGKKLKYDKNDKKAANKTIGLEQGIKSTKNQAGICKACLKAEKCTRQNCSECKRECENVDTDQTDDEMDPKDLAALKKRVSKNMYTSEPIPDYIMRALQPKKSVHPEYGKLRY